MQKAELVTIAAVSRLLAVVMDEAMAAPTRAQEAPHALIPALGAHLVELDLCDAPSADRTGRTLPLTLKPRVRSPRGS